MSEKTYALHIEREIPAVWDQLHITKAQAKAIREQCQKIEAQKQRQWRAGDFFLMHADQEYPERFGLMDWDCIPTFFNGGRRDPSYAASGPKYVEDRDYTYLDNLFDLLQQGEILVAVSEKGLQHITETFFPTCGECKQLKERFNAALDAYRERKAQP